MQEPNELVGQPPAAIFTCGFDPLRDVGMEYARKLDMAGVSIQWHHYDDLTHGWLQMTAWSYAARDATLEVGKEVRRLLYGES
jgi:acetyl esterase/lipase